MCIGYNTMKISKFTDMICSGYVIYLNNTYLCLLIILTYHLYGTEGNEA